MCINRIYGAYVAGKEEWIYKTRISAVCRSGRVDKDCKTKLTVRRANSHAIVPAGAGIQMKDNRQGVWRPLPVEAQSRREAAVSDCSQLGADLSEAIEQLVRDGLRRQRAGERRDQVVRIRCRGDGERAARGSVRT